MKRPKPPAHHHYDRNGDLVHGGDALCHHNWVEWVGQDGELLEPATDVCNSCGGVLK